MTLATSSSVDPNRSPITLMACLIAVVIFTICSSAVIARLLFRSDHFSADTSTWERSIGAGCRDACRPDSCRPCCRQTAPLPTGRSPLVRSPSPLLLAGQLLVLLPNIVATGLEHTGQD